MIKEKPNVGKIDLGYIKSLREKNSFSKTFIAESLGLKTTEKYSRREDGTYNFQVDELPKLAEIFNVKIESFFK